MAKSEKEIDELMENNEITLISDYMIGYIGLSFVLMSFIDILFEISDVFLIGATISGYCFIFAEIVIFKRPVIKIMRVLYGVLLFLGVFSFITLPAILLAIPWFYDFFSGYSKQATLITLGSVLILLDLNANKRRIKTFETIKSLVNSIRQENEERAREFEKRIIDLEIKKEKSDI